MIEALELAVIVYISGLILLRLAKTRLLKGMTSLDMLLVVILGSVLARAINGNSDYLTTMSAAAGLIACHWFFTYLCTKSSFFGKLLKGCPRLIIVDGEIDEKAMKQEHISIHDVEAEMRRHGVSSVSDVKAARLERSGEISIIRR